MRRLGAHGGGAVWVGAAAARALAWDQKTLLPHGAWQGAQGLCSHEHSCLLPQCIHRGHRS